MSTTPGKDTWADAGLVPPQDAETPTRDEDVTLPDVLPADAAEADALEQQLGAEGMPDEPPHVREDAADHDVIEQAQDVPLDDEEYPTP